MIRTDLSTRPRSKKANHGIALFTVLVVIMVLTILTVAFIQTNKENFSLLNSASDKAKAQAACKSVYEYILFNLEHNKYWGVDNFKGAQDNSLPYNMTVEEVKDTHKIIGTMPELDASFTAQIWNNLNNDAESPDGVPPECARIVITAQTKHSTRTLEALLHVAPLFDASAISGGDLDIHAKRLAIRSLDPYRNLVRAKGKITVPEVLTAQKTRFLQPKGNEYDPKGMLWSRGDIVSGGSGGKRITDTNLSLANKNSGGHFLPNAKQHFEIFKLEADQIEVPSHTVAILPGEYRFTTATANLNLTTDYTYKKKELFWDKTKTGSTSWSTQIDINVLAYYKTPGQEPPTAVFRGDITIDPSKIPLDPNVAAKIRSKRKGKIKSTTIDSVNVTYTSNGITTPVNVHHSNLIDLALDPNNKGLVQADLNKQEVILSPGITVTAKGDLQITSDRDQGRPKLIFTKGDQRTALIVDKSLVIQNGTVDGLGTLIAKTGDIRLQVVVRTIG